MKKSVMAFWMYCVVALVATVAACSMDTGANNRNVEIGKASVTVEITKEDPSKSAIQVDKLQIIKATIVLDNGQGDRQEATWTPETPFVFSFQAISTGDYTLTITDWDTEGNVNSESVLIDIEAGYNYKINVLLGGKITIAPVQNIPTGGPTAGPTTAPTQGPIKTETEVFDIPDTYTWAAPSNMVGDTITLELVGGGGGGGGSFDYCVYGTCHLYNGEGGNAGKNIPKHTITIDRNAQYTIIVGNPGKAGENGYFSAPILDSKDPQPGASGTNSSFKGSSISEISKGGAGGSAGTENSSFTSNGVRSGQVLGYGDGGDGGCQCNGKGGYIRITYSVFVQ